MSKELIVYDRPKDNWGGRLFQDAWRKLGTKQTGQMCHQGFAQWFGNLLNNRRTNIHLTITLASRRTPAAYLVTYEKRKDTYWGQTLKIYCPL